MRTGLITWLLLTLFYLLTRLAVQYLAAGFLAFPIRFWVEVVAIPFVQALVLVLVSRALPGLLKR
ncbi:MAG: hypothetical protein ACE15E_17510 [Acidobacteriota bacterium]